MAIATREVNARFPGPVRSVKGFSANAFRAGQILAVVESHDSLRSYALSAPINGVVLRDTNVGDVAGDARSSRSPTCRSSGSICIVRGRPGVCAVDSRCGSRPRRAAGGRNDLQRLLPIGPREQPDRARACGLPNTQAMATRLGRQRGSDSGRASSATRRQDVRAAALPRLHRRLRAGRRHLRGAHAGARERDGDWIEVLGGLEPGAAYVTEHSFLIKADIEKSGASHDH